MDMVHGSTRRKNGDRAVSVLAQESRDWLTSQGFAIRDESLWLEALTHGSTGETFDYQRLEFLGDRVLGLSVAEWLVTHSDSDEGKLAQRLNSLVSKGACATVARAIGVQDHVRLGKQAHDDGAAESENVLGDVMESLLGAAFIDGGFEPARAIVQRLWSSALTRSAVQGKHPKSALQEWAAGNRRKPPEYRLVERNGPDHRAQFTVEVSIHKVGSATATASSKQDAETEAARRFMEQYG